MATWRADLQQNLAAQRGIEWQLEASCKPISLPVRMLVKNTPLPRFFVQQLDMKKAAMQSDRDGLRAIISSKFGKDSFEMSFDGVL